MNVLPSIADPKNPVVLKGTDAREKNTFCNAEMSDLAMLIPRGKSPPASARLGG
jgi:hypothetical protein